MSQYAKQNAQIPSGFISFFMAFFFAILYLSKTIPIMSWNNLGVVLFIMGREWWLLPKQQNTLQIWGRT